MAATLTEPPKRLRDCRACPRLVAHHAQIRQRYPTYHAAPVGAWGNANPRLLMVGLAPGLHGAARTGRAFVGDASGRFLFASLMRTGWAVQDTSAPVRLVNARITNVVKCLPPGNAPQTSEIANCSGYLSAELAAFCPLRARKPRVVLAFGGLAHRAVCRALGLRNARFSHAGQWRVHRHLTLVASYHPSRLNVNTGRLTPAMLDAVFEQVRRSLEV